MDAKIITRGDTQEKPEYDTKALMFDFGGQYAKYDVCTEIGLDASLFGQENGLQKVRDILIPQVHALGERNL